GSAGGFARASPCLDLVSLAPPPSRIAVHDRGCCRGNAPSCSPATQNCHGPRLTHHIGKGAARRGENTIEWGGNEDVFAGDVARHATPERGFRDANSTVVCRIVPTRHAPPLPPITIAPLREPAACSNGVAARPSGEGNGVATAAKL